MAESVCKFLEARGHFVTRSRDVIPPDSPDPIVAKAAQDADAILISEDGDFRGIIQRKGRRFKKLSRVSLRCGSAQTANRIAAVISLIEFEFEQCQARQDKRLMIEIHISLIRILR